ncbi:MAG TPA: glycosyltransferase [Pseudolabrys sp.]|jgi:glycosyltransferase involved in cell wall biosynthesis|nr:glycosyltransferase [Pseudolabrys sp.]
MRILHVVPSYLPAVRYGGPIFTVHGLCRALAAKGHELQVFTTNIDGPGITATPIATPVDLDGIQIRYFPCPLVRRLYWAPALGRALHLELGKLDVVHLHSVFLWPTWAAARAARKARVPYVLSPRGMLVKDLIARRSRLTKSAWIHLIERSNVEQAAALHLTSQLEGTEIERFGWRLPRLAIIPNAIDEPLSQNGKIASDVEAITSQQPLVLFLGRLSWKKGLDRLLRAFALTPAGILAVVGTDDENFAPQLAKLAAELRIADRLRILPRTVIGSEKERLFAAARLFVLPSYSENFGNTVLEAMRRGVPIVVTPEVGAAEIVRTSGAGLVVGGDIEPLSSAIRLLTADLALARSMGEAGRRHVAAHFTWDQVATQMEDLYNSLKH